MTKQQLELLRFIKTFIAQRGYSPSFEEMKQGIGLKSKSGIHRMIISLERQGQIRRLRNRHRALELVPDPSMKPDLSGLSDFDLAREAKRRHLVLGHMHRDEFGGREFVQIAT